MAKNTNKDKQMAAYLKDMGIVRTSQMCPNCYRIISCDSNKSRYNHICK